MYIYICYNGTVRVSRFRGLGVSGCSGLRGLGFRVLGLISSLGRPETLSPGVRPRVKSQGCTLTVASSGRSISSGSQAG